MLSKRIAFCMSLAAVGAVGGCVDPQAAGDGQTPEYIYRVVCFYPPNMWQSFDQEGDLNPEGLAFVMYLLSSKTSKGTHADGLVHVKMYRIDRRPDGSTERTLVRDWTAGTSELRRRTPTKFGYGYDVYLHWDDLDILGQEVEIVVQYESPAGRLVQSQTKQTRVPPRKV